MFRESVGKPVDKDWRGLRKACRARVSGRCPWIGQGASQGFVEGADSPKAVALREAFAIADKPTTMEEAKRKWREESPIWIRLTDQLGIKLD